METYYYWKAISEQVLFFLFPNKHKYSGLTIRWADQLQLPVPQNINIQTTKFLETHAFDCSGDLRLRLYKTAVIQQYFTKKKKMKCIEKWVHTIKWSTRVSQILFCTSCFWLLRVNTLGPSREIGRQSSCSLSQKWSVNADYETSCFFHRIIDRKVLKNMSNFKKKSRIDSE